MCNDGLEMIVNRHESTMRCAVFCVVLVIVVAGCSAPSDPLLEPSPTGTFAGAAIDFHRVNTISLGPENSSHANVRQLVLGSRTSFLGKIVFDDYNDTDVQVIVVEAASNPRSKSLFSHWGVAGKYRTRSANAAQGASEGTCLDGQERLPCESYIRGGERQEFPLTSASNSIEKGTWQLIVLGSHARRFRLDLNFSQNLYASEWVSIPFRHLAFKSDDTAADSQKIHACATIVCGNISGGRFLFPSAGMSRLWLSSYAIARAGSSIRGCYEWSELHLCLAANGPAQPDPQSLQDYRVQRDGRLVKGPSSARLAYINASSHLPLRAGFDFRVSAWSFD
jgi:hypothetical protein